MKSVLEKVPLPFSWVVVPVRSRIMDKNIVYFYNAAFFFTTIVAVVIFILGLKGWADFAPVIAGANMWMDPTYEQQNLNDTPVYCNNPDFDYVYSDSWNYENNRCVEMSVNEIFRKGGGHPGAFWTTTYITMATLQHNKCNFTTQECTGQSRIIGKNQNFFVKHLEDFQIAAQISAEVPDLNYDGRTSDARLMFQQPSGKIVEIKNAKKLLTMMKISEWLKHFEIDTLDGTGIDAVYSVAESKGHCRYRIAGLSLIFEIEVRNSLSPWDHPGEIFVLVKLSVDKNWARITYKPVPTATLGIARAVDHYGIRWVWRTIPPKVHVFSWEKVFLSSLNIVIFFTVMNNCVHFAVLHMCGKDSKRWRKTVEPVMKFYEEVEEVIHHRRESLVMLERQNKLSMNDDGANNSKYTVREDL